MDERLAQIEKEKQAALQQSNDAYAGMLQDNQNLYNQQNSYAEQYEQSQNKMLDKQLAFNEQKIEQQKEIAKQNKETEEKKAKNDYFSYINPYGVQAESFASNGLLNSGVSETAKLGGYNTYQNRLATANKVMQDAFLQYDNDINEARLNNDVQKAQNALARLQMQLQYSENYYNQKNNLTQNQLQNNQSLNSEYYGRYSDEYNRYLEEQQRQEAIRQWEQEFAEQQRQYNENLAYQKAQAEEENRRYNEQLEYQKQQDALAQQNWEKEYALSKQKTNSSSGSNISLSDGSLSQNLSDDSASNSIQNIKTDYYEGAINPDVQYGTFRTKDKNGVNYQPNNVGGNKLSSSGKKVSQFLETTGNTGASGANIDNQTVWTTNGKYYVWDGSQNRYVDITSLQKSTSTKQGGGIGSFGFGSGGGVR